MLDRLEGPLRMTIKSCIGEDDKVAVEAESLGTLKNGRTYNQEYHMLITVRDEKISAVREYLDTLHVQSVWYQP
jgi:ketosteroid isomerase-like protein